MCFYDILHYNLILYVYYNGDKMIELLKFLLLPVVQGISEVLPISSSGHLQIVEWLLGMDTSSLTLSIFLHLGSLIALIGWFAFDSIIALIIGLFTSLISSICFEITLIATFLFAVIGFLMINDENSIFTDFDKTTYKLSLFLCILSLLMSLL